MAATEGWHEREHACFPDTGWHEGRLSGSEVSMAGPERGSCHLVWTTKMPFAGRTAMWRQTRLISFHDQRVLLQARCSPREDIMGGGTDSPATMERSRLASDQKGQAGKDERRCADVMLTGAHRNRVS